MREIRLGIFFFVVLIVLGFVTVTVSQWTPPWVRRHVFTIYFPNADGLKRGDQVRVVGVPYGRVDRVEYNRGRKEVEVTVGLEHRLDLREDYTITIQESALIGGRYIEIFPGSEEKRPFEGNDPAAPLRGTSLPSPVQELAKVVQENRENIRETLEDVREVARSIREGPGTLHELVSNRTLYEKVEKAADHLEKAGEQLVRGEGTAAKLLQDPALYDDLRAVAADLRTVTTQVREGPGLVHDLLYNAELSKDLKAAVEDIRGAAASLREIIEKVQSGEKPLLAYAVDEQTYGKAEQAIEDFGKVVGRAARTEVGLLGGAMFYPRSGMNVYRLAIRLQPGENKYFQAGASFLSLDPDGDVKFEDQRYDEGDTLIKADVLAAYRFDFIADWLKPVWLRGGLIEGKGGGAVDLEWKDLDWLLGGDLRLSYEIRDAYGSVENEDLDEEIRGPLQRAYATIRLWKGFRAYVGASRLGAGNSPELMAGGSFEFNDEDLRSIIALLGLAN